MRISIIATLAAATLPSAASAQAPAKSVSIDRNILHVQVILDHLGFGPGVLDGRGGQSLVAALKGFQEAKGIAVTGKPDAATLQALYPYRQWRPTTTVTLTQDMVAGPFVNPLPKDYALQAKLPSIAYRNKMEKLAEMFHTTQPVLLALNSPNTSLSPGAKIVVPDITAKSEAYDEALRPDWRATLASLNVDASQPKADHIVVDKSDGVLRVLDAQNKLIAQFSATMGSSHDPLPIGTWKIYGADYNPKFRYNPALFWDSKKGSKGALLPAAPTVRWAWCGWTCRRSITASTARPVRRRSAVRKATAVSA